MIYPLWILWISVTPEVCPNSRGMMANSTSGTESPRYPLLNDHIAGWLEWHPPFFTGNPYIFIFFCPAFPASELLVYQLLWAHTSIATRRWRHFNPPAQGLKWLSVLTFTGLVGWKCSKLQKWWDVWVATKKQDFQYTSPLMRSDIVQWCRNEWVQRWSLQNLQLIGFTFKGTPSKTNECPPKRSHFKRKVVF